MKKKIGIIGGGPAGMMAAIMASSKNNEIYLIEKNNKLGKKMFITGKGRCNITNAIPIEDFFEYIVSNKNFLYSSLYSFTNENIMELLKEYNLDLKIERGNRVFPKSDKSSDVINTFQKILNKSNVNILLNSKVEDIVYEDNKFLVNINGENHNFDKLILSTGGKSYPTTGSTGDGYIFAEKMGHTVTEIRPSLVPIEIKDNWTKSLQGLSLKNITLKAFKKDKLIHEEFGEMIFTHFGISGPIVLSTSNFLSRYKDLNFYFKIDLKPALDFDTLDKRILRDFEKYNNKQLKNSLNDLLPQKIIPIIILLSKIDEKTIVNQITKGQRYKLISTIKDLSMDFKNFRPIEEAIITSGGVSTKEINPSTMESKIVPNLFFAGEIIDVDALTGGFNLQIAYSTGHLAGINV